MTDVAAIIPVDGRGAAIDTDMLARTVARMARVPGVTTVVLVHPADAAPPTSPADVTLENPLRFVASHRFAVDQDQAARMIGRRWAPTAWRGGLGGVTCYDELLPAGPLVDALDASGCGSAVLAGAAWPLVDPQLTGRVLALHLKHEDAMAMTFCQAPPGLAGVAIRRSLLEELAGSRSCFGQLLRYNPSRPQADPIGRDVCVQVPALVRECGLRFIADAPRWRALVDDVISDAGEEADGLDAKAVVRSAMARATQADAVSARLPQQVTLELTVRRRAAGPLTPQHHQRIDRQDMPADLAIALLEQLRAEPDTVITFGGLGDPMLHPDLDIILGAVRALGIAGVALETDLLVDAESAQRLLTMPVDLVSVWLNADTEATYATLMAPEDGFDFRQVTRNLEVLLNTRNRRSVDDPAQPAGVPWIVPRLRRCQQTLAEMESFFDRWMHYAGHAVIDPPLNGCGAAPPDPLIQPPRLPCRQAGGRPESGGRMRILSDGSVPFCDEDWAGRRTAGKAGSEPLLSIWQHLRRGPGTAEWVCPACERYYGLDVSATSEPSIAVECAV